MYERAASLGRNQEEGGCDPPVLPNHLGVAIKLQDVRNSADIAITLAIDQRQDRLQKSQQRVNVSTPPNREALAAIGPVLTAE
jgi:hypothetical protein